MSGLTTDSHSIPGLPSELFLRILALLAPQDLALSGRLSCKAAAQRFSELHHRTLNIDQPLPSHAVTTTATTAVRTSSNTTTTTVTSVTSTCPELLLSGEAAMQELTFRRKLLLVSRAAATGCAANVEYAWQLLQPHVFPELLQSSRYCRTVLQQDHEAPVPDVGSAAVSSGLAHLLPLLAQRCPGLLDPCRTLEAAARHCDLAGLQAAWGLLRQRIQSSLEQEGGPLPGSHAERVQGFWQRMLAGAAGSTAPEATSMMEWVLANTPAACARASILSHACGAAAASGDLARVRWLRERGVDWGAPTALEAVLEHAQLGFVQRLEEQGGYLPAANNDAWRCSILVSAAAAASRDSEAKLQWLAGRGACLESASDAVCKAAERDNMAALELLLQHWRGGALPDQALSYAAAAGSIATASWLRQAGCALTKSVFLLAFCRGDLAMVRWLLEAGSPRGGSDTLGAAMYLWPRDTAADGQRLVEALRLLAAAGWPMGVAGAGELITRAAHTGHPWAVWQGVLQLFELHPVAVPCDAARHAAAVGCRATLEALERMGLHDRGSRDDDLVSNWYADAATNGDRGTLAWLRRQGAPGRGVVMEAAVEGAPLAVLRWLVEQGAILDNMDMMRVLDLKGNASPAPYRWVQKEVEAWLRGCFRRWICRALLATVWSICVMVVAVAAAKEFDRRQYGFWGSTAVWVLVPVIWLVAVALWAIPVHVAHTQRWAPIQLYAKLCTPARRTSAAF